MGNKLTITPEYMKFGVDNGLNTTELFFYIYTENFFYNNYYDFLYDFPIFNIKEKTLQRIINKLERKGILEKQILNDCEIKERLSQKEGANFICSWCGDKVFVLHEHHYPIPKSKGGTETVKICPNCHYGFHYIAGVNWSRE